MTLPEEHHRYQEQIGALLLGKLDEGERKAMQAHLSSCPVCQAEVRELKPVVGALAYAAPDRIDEDPQPPEDLEELTLAPILGDMHRARRRRRRSRWSALAAAAICVVVLGLAGFTWLLQSEVRAEPLSFDGVAPGVEVKGSLMAHAWSTKIRLDVSGLRDGQTHRVTLVSEDGERVNVDTFIGLGDESLRCTFNAARLREDATRLEVRTTPGGELVFFAKLPEHPRVAGRDSPLFGILPWGDSGLQNEITGACGPESTEGPSAEDPGPDDKQKKLKSDGSGGGTPNKESSPESDDKRPYPGGEMPGPAPEASEPGRVPPAQPPVDPSPREQSPTCDQYGCQP